MQTQSLFTEVDTIAGINFGLCLKSNMSQLRKLAEPESSN
jgi:hypothetical protein